MWGLEVKLSGCLDQSAPKWVDVFSQEHLSQKGEFGIFSIHSLVPLFSTRS